MQAHNNINKKGHGYTLTRIKRKWKKIKKANEYHKVLHLYQRSKKMKMNYNSLNPNIIVSTNE